MSRRLFLGMIFMTMFSLPVVALADETESSSANTTSELIKTGALCDVTTLGVAESDNPITLYARWRPRTYQCAKGEYLFVGDGSVRCETCPKDSYCPAFNEPDSSHTYVPDESSYGIYQCDEGYTVGTMGNFDPHACKKVIQCSDKNPVGNDIIPHSDAATTTYVNEETTCSQPVDGVQDCTLSCEIDTLGCESGYKAKFEEGVWSCEQNFVDCPAGTYLPGDSTECATCPENSFCAGGRYTFPDPDGGKAEDLGIVECPEGLKAPERSTSINDCGILMRVDGDALYLRAERVNNGNPAFVTKDASGKKWYATMTKVSENSEPRKVSEGAKKELHVKIGDTEYTVHTVTSQDLGTQETGN